MTSLVHAGRPGDDIDSLRERAGELEAALDQRHAEVERTRGELNSFRIRYRQDVGLLHEQLDELEIQLAEAELGILRDRLGDDAPPAAEEPAADRIDVAPRSLTSDAVRKLFRDVAKAIHPDLAQDDLARDRRHSLMIEANRAYALGDEAQLRWILEVWERSPEAVQGTDQGAMRLRLMRRIEEIEQELELLTADLAKLHASPSWELKLMVDKASAEGKDLVTDMVRRLKRDILVATNRLDALRAP